jgi:hypothetical protein
MVWADLAIRPDRVNWYDEKWASKITNDRADGHRKLLIFFYPAKCDVIREWKL